jgi:leucyl aminopeptidase
MAIVQGRAIRSSVVGHGRKLSQGHAVQSRSVATIRLSTRTADHIQADALVIGTCKRGHDVELAGVVHDELLATMKAMKATGDIGELVKTASSGLVPASVIIGVGLGDADEVVELETLRRAAGAALAAAAGHPHVAVALPAVDLDELAAVAEGALLGAYVYDEYLETKRPRVDRITVSTPIGRRSPARARLDAARVVAGAVNLSRDLVNAPPNELYPETFVSQIRAAATGKPVRITVLDEARLRRKGYGGIVSVGIGSGRPPRLLRISYRPRRVRRHIALVGKGITFDSGGYTIKPGPSMVAMKSDMAGASAVAAAALAIAEIGLPIQITAYAALAENMVSGEATRPGDIVTMYGGKTVEVTNTDAEGRMVLADALTTACADRPDAIVDVATLTAHVTAALGNRVAGLFGDDDELRDALAAAAAASGESLWSLPIPEEVREKVRGSRVADLSQVSGERAGGAAFAAGFLREFVTGSIPWVHVDMAGPAFNDDSPYGYTPRGGTGMMVRTLIRLAANRA